MLNNFIRPKPSLAPSLSPKNNNLMNFNNKAATKGQAGSHHRSILSTRPPVVTLSEESARLKEQQNDFFNTLVKTTQMTTTAADDTSVKEAEQKKLEIEMQQQNIQVKVEQKLVKVDVMEDEVKVEEDKPDMEHFVPENFKVAHFNNSEIKPEIKPEIKTEIKENVKSAEHQNLPASPITDIAQITCNLQNQVSQAQTLQNSLNLSQIYNSPTPQNNAQDSINHSFSPTTQQISALNNSALSSPCQGSPDVGGKIRNDGFTSVRRRTLHSDVPKPHECTICNSKFTRYHNLKQHIKLHSGIKPYQCEHCGKRFTRNYTLRLHKQKVCNSERLNSRGGNTENSTETLLRNLQIPTSVPSMSNLSQLLQNSGNSGQHFAFDSTLLGPGVKKETEDSEEENHGNGMNDE